MADALLRMPRGADWSNFEKRIGISNSKLSGSGSSSSGTPDFDKICVLIRYISDCYNHKASYEFFVYVIDVNSDLYAPSPQIQSLEPVISWDLHQINCHAFATLGSKLCMFGEMVVSPKGSLVWGYDMYYYDMQRDLNLDSPQHLLSEKSLIKGPKMSGRKEDPLAAMMGDSKICVFGSVLYPSGEDYSGGPNFELLYTTTTGDLAWKVLPEVPLIYDKLDKLYSICIRSYCVHRSCLIIDINGNGVFGINVDHRDPKWVTLNQSESTDFPFQGMFAMVDEVLCDGFCMVKRVNLIPTDRMELEFPSNRKSVVIPDGIRAACFDDRSNTFCLAQGAFDPLPEDDHLMPTFKCCTGEDASYLLVDIFKLDVPNLRAVTSKSFTFLLPKYPYSDCMEIAACLPIKNASRNNKSVAEVDQGKKKKMNRKVTLGNIENIKPRVTLGNIEKMNREVIASKVKCPKP